MVAGDPITTTDRAVGGLSSGTKSKGVNFYKTLLMELLPSSFTISYDVARNTVWSFKPQKKFAIKCTILDNDLTYTSGTDFLTSFAGDADRFK